MKIDDLQKLIDVPKLIDVGLYSIQVEIDNRYNNKIMVILNKSICIGWDEIRDSISAYYMRDGVVNENLLQSYISDVNRKILKAFLEVVYEKLITQYNTEFKSTYDNITIDTNDAPTEEKLKIPSGKSKCVVDPSTPSTFEPLESFEAYIDGYVMQGHHLHAVTVRLSDGAVHMYNIEHVTVVNQLTTNEI